MRESIPPALAALYDAPDAASRERAWADFVAAYSDLLLRVARLFGGDHDAIMDRYAFILEQLGRDGFHRLRAYRADGRGQFTTWLVFVARRLCLDEHRHRFGRTQARGTDALNRRQERRSLVELVGHELDLAALAAPPDEEADVSLRRHELASVLHAAVATLDVADRLLLRLRFEDELSVPRIARIVGAPTPFHVYRRLDRILGVLRVALRSAGVEDAVP